MKSPLKRQDYVDENGQHRVRVVGPDEMVLMDEKLVVFESEKYRTIARFRASALGTTELVAFERVLRSEVIGKDFSSSRVRVPAFAVRILDFVAPASMVDVIVGDLEELYYRKSIKYSVCYAKIWCWWHVFRSIPGCLYSGFIISVLRAIKQGLK